LLLLLSLSPLLLLLLLLLLGLLMLAAILRPGIGPFRKMRADGDLNGINIQRDAKGKD
jgi:hypothetical protein